MEYPAIFGIGIIMALSAIILSRTHPRRNADAVFGLGVAGIGISILNFIL